MSLFAPTIIYYIELQCTYAPNSQSFTWTVVTNNSPHNTNISLNDAVNNWTATDMSSPLEVTLCFKIQRGNNCVNNDYCINPIPGLTLEANITASYDSFNNKKKSYALVRLTENILKQNVENQVKTAIERAFTTSGTTGGAKNTVYNFSNLPRNRDNKNDYYVYTKV